MHYAWAMAGAWTQQWSEMATTYKDPLFYIRDIPQIAVLAWIVTQAEDAVVATYVVVGVVLLTTSNRSLWRCSRWPGASRATRRPRIATRSGWHTCLPGGGNTYAAPLLGGTRAECTERAAATAPQEKGCVLRQTRPVALTRRHGIPAYQ